MTSEKKYPSQLADKFIIRFSEKGMRDKIRERAANNRRSMNSEILNLIEAGMNDSLEADNADKH